MFDDNDLRDPAPPTPGAPERAKVAVRAKQIKRNRRLTAAGGALGLVAVMSLGAVALAGGGSSGTGTSRIEVAGAVADRTTPTTPAPTTVAPTPTTLAPAPAPTTAPAVTSTNTPAPSVQETPAPAATFTVSGTVPGVPDGVTGTVRLVGDAGTFTGSFGPGGAFSISGVPAGHYGADYSWTSADGSASQAGRAPSGVDVNGDASFTFPG